MRLRTLRRRRREGMGAGLIAIMGAGGILAGTALAWFLWPGRGAERRERTGRALREAAARARAEGRAVSTRANEVLHGAPDRIRTGASAALEQAGRLPERARAAADALRGGADRGRAALEARGWSPGQAALGVAGTALIGRAVLGRGLMRIPAGFLGASILERAVSGLRTRRAGEADAPARPGAHEERAVGASRRVVREGKSPGELDQEAATDRSASPFADRGPQTAAGDRMTQAGRAGTGQARVLGPDGEPVTHREPDAGE